MLCLFVSGVHAQDEEPTGRVITGDRLSGFVLPIEPLAADMQLESLRGWAWTVDDTKRLLLEGDVRVSIGTYALYAESAVIWINRVPSAEGLINQVALYFPDVEDPTKRAGLGVTGRNVLITASTRGEVKLRTSALESQRPRSKSLITRGEERFKTHLQQLAAAKPALRTVPRVEAVTPVRTPLPVPGGTPPEVRPETTDRVELPPEQFEGLPLFAPTGSVRFTWGRLVMTTSEVENTIALSGPVMIEYVARDDSEDWQYLTLSAERAVVFSNPATVESMFQGQMDASTIRGIYLEGNVIADANNGQYLIRAPRMYYDFGTNQAVMVNAVLRTYVRETNQVVYARAEEMRQVARDEWLAKKATISQSAFFEPHLSIGADTVTVRQRPTSSGGEATFFDSRDNTLRASGMPFLYWPRLAGDVESIPLRQFNVGNRESDGLRIETAWDLYALLGIDRPRGTDLELAVDGYTKRGAGAGLKFEYDFPRDEGLVDLYGLFDDGTDRTSAGEDVDHDNEFRGLALWEHTSRLTEFLTLQAQVASISDPSYISTWRERDFEERRDYETSLYLKNQKRNEALTFLAKYELNEFISNSALLASRGYAVERLPELTYRRFGDAFFGDRFTYSGETRVSRMRLAMDRSTPRELGVPGSAFGLGPDDQISDSLKAGGLSEKFISRFDTRHEVAYPMQWGIFQATPFFVGRLTAYDDDFESFSSDADEYRFFGSAGIRVNTTFQRVYNGVESRLFDLNRLRNLLEPRLVLWYGYTSVDSVDLPEYDFDVESLASGAAIELGFTNTLQTQRGGPGRWRSVDWIKWDAAVVVNTDEDNNRRSPNPQFFDDRPEYGQWGDHFRTSIIWLLSDSLSIGGETTYSFEDDDFSRSSIGMELRHSPVLTTFAEYRYLNYSDNELLDIGWNYEVTPKYAVQLRPQWDLRRDEFRAFRIRLTRTFPDFYLTFEIEQDEIQDETTVGASLSRVEF